MSVTLDQILTLVGELDDEPGFDAPRERFRRFLLEYGRDTEIVRALVYEAQHTPGKQHHRALQDLVVLLGQFLGFKTAFGTYLPVAGGVTYQGQWRSRSRVQVVLEIRTDQTTTVNLDTLVRSVAAVTSTASSSGARQVGLCVLTPSYTHRHKVEKALAAGKHAVPVGVVTLDDLLSLADMAGAGRVTHDEAVRLLESDLPVDFIVTLLERSPGGRAVEGSRPVRAVPLAARPVLEEPGFWIATVTSDYATAPEELLELVVGRRHIFGITDDPPVGGAAPRSGDRICFYISGKGVVGHALIASIARSGTGMRDAHRFRHLLHLDDVELYLKAAVALDVETELRVRATPPFGTSLRAQTLAPIPRESFVALTVRREAANADSTTRDVGEVPASGLADAPVTAAD